MSPTSLERETINIPSTRDQPATVPCYDFEDCIRSALQNWQEGDLLQLVVDHEEELIQFVSLNRDIAPDLVNKHLESANAKNVALYRSPISHDTILIWYRCSATSSVKRIRTQNRVRRDLVWYASGEGVRDIVTLSMHSNEHVTVSKLKDICCIADET
ncbi:hypothetical protein FVEN_g9607 [Fusarium venenatum]|uniref:uncharacterized protein n=1 Tax=Fusarium venenatum TaxID=56646 RepID=UPI001DA142DB|nr:hypothetical protein FVEN_g9607 [Fusarium venenatum]KAH7002738.1 hypothetical protein EDB82DRAFT_481921 [Fusarium venenatum]